MLPGLPVSKRGGELQFSWKTSPSLAPAAWAGTRLWTLSVGGGRVVTLKSQGSKENSYPEPCKSNVTFTDGDEAPKWGHAAQ